MIKSYFVGFFVLLNSCSQKQVKQCSEANKKTVVNLSIEFISSVMPDMNSIKKITAEYEKKEISKLEFDQKLELASKNISSSKAELKQQLAAFIKENPECSTDQIEKTLNR